MFSSLGGYASSPQFTGGGLIRRTKLLVCQKDTKLVKRMYGHDSKHHDFIHTGIKDNPKTDNET